MTISEIKKKLDRIERMLKWLVVNMLVKEKNYAHMSLPGREVIEYLLLHDENYAGLVKMLPDISDILEEK